MIKEVKFRQLAFFIISFLPISKLLSMGSIMAGFAQNDMWISVSINLIAELLVFVAMCYMLTHSDINIYTLLKNKIGVIGQKIILTIFLFYFLLKAILPISETKDYVRLTLYITMPTILTFVPFFISCYYFSKQKLRCIGRLSDLLWIFSILAFITLFALAVTNADFSDILPIGVNGAKNIFHASYYSLNWFGDMCYLLFFVGEVKEDKKGILKLSISFIIYVVMVLGFAITFYSVFGPIAFRQRFAMTESSKYTTVINNTGRFDYVAICIILFNSIFSISLPIFFASRVLRELFGFDKTWLSSLISTLVAFIVVILLNGFSSSIEKFILQYSGILFILCGYILPLLSPLLIFLESPSKFVNLRMIDKLKEKKNEIY